MSRNIPFLIFNQIDSSWPEYAIKGSRCMNFDFTYVLYTLILALNVKYAFRLFNTVLILFISCAFMIEVGSPFEFISWPRYFEVLCAVIILLLCLQFISSFWFYDII